MPDESSEEIERRLGLLHYMEAETVMVSEMDFPKVNLDSSLLHFHQCISIGVLGLLDEGIVRL